VGPFVATESAAATATAGGGNPIAKGCVAATVASRMLAASFLANPCTGPELCNSDAMICTESNKKKISRVPNQAQNNKKQKKQIQKGKKSENDNFFPGCQMFF
jgi:hypothetical protein